MSASSGRGGEEKTREDALEEMVDSVMDSGNRGALGGNELSRRNNALISAMRAQWAVRWDVRAG